MVTLSLGICIKMDLGVEQNYNEALRWYRVAANRGSAWGKNNMGWMYENGCGVPKNLTEAAKWYREASGQGLFVAKENLTRLGHSE
jgi:TPR repeat protein